MDKITSDYLEENRVVIRALVVDDSALMRKMVKDILETDPDIQVIATAFNGKDAVEKTLREKPDVITMDVEMPEMNGIDAVRAIMEQQPTPIIMVSALTTNSAQTTFEALDAGAVDYICKPSGSISLNIKDVQVEIIQKVKVAAQATLRSITKAHALEPDTKIRVVLVDDSPFIRKIVKESLHRSPDISVVGEASTGKEAVSVLEKITADVILMDIEMPDGNGVYATKIILQHQFVPIVLFSGKTSDGLDEIKEALTCGAVDFIPKPNDHGTIHSIMPLVQQKIREAALKTSQESVESITNTGEQGILLIGSSTGGPQTLAEIIPQIPGNIHLGILIVQHMPPVFTKSLAERLDRISQISVKEASEGDEILPGQALVAPGNYHMTISHRIENGKTKYVVSLNQEERIHGVRPSVDVTFSSAAKIFKDRTIGVILTGMGRDGAHSMGLIKANGGYTIAQDKNTSIIFGMPDAAIKLGVVDKILPLHSIIPHINKQLHSGQKVMV